MNISINQKKLSSIFLWDYFLFVALCLKRGNIISRCFASSNLIFRQRMWHCDSQSLLFVTVVVVVVVYQVGTYCSNWTLVVEMASGPMVIGCWELREVSFIWNYANHLSSNITSPLPWVGAGLAFHSTYIMSDSIRSADIVSEFSELSLDQMVVHWSAIGSSPLFCIVSLRSLPGSRYWLGHNRPQKSRRRLVYAFLFIRLDNAQ